MKDKYKRGVVICKLPNAGLGNQLFPLMKAYTFAHLNNLPITVYNYHQIKIGPWLRKDRSKRNYKGFFFFQKNLFGELIDKWRVRQIDKRLQTTEPGVKKLERESRNGESFFFSMMPHYTNYFEGLSEHRGLVIQLLNEILSTSIKKKLNQIKPSAIAVHIRRGDFRIPAVGEQLGSRGILRTPDSYFIDMIKSIRIINGSELSVNIFSDAPKAELSEILKLPNINVVQGNKDLEDLLLLSRSSILITSAGSTFSYWAGFISDAPIIMHPTYTGIKIRPECVRDELYEGEFDEESAILINKIRSINQAS